MCGDIMESYINEICNVCKLPFNEIINDYKVIQISNKAIVVNNYIKILDYSSNKISLKVKKDILSILGNDLYISQINQGEIVIKGIIYSCGVGDKNNEE